MLVAANFRAEDSDWINCVLYLLSSIVSKELGGSSAASVGDLQSRPNSRNEGFSPVASCGVLRYAQRTPDGYLSHCTPYCAACFRNIVFRVRLNLSVNPSHCG